MNWRYVGSTTFGLTGTPTAAQALDALFTLANSATYFDGAVRTQGAGSAGTWSRVQVGATTECLICNPPTNTLSQRIMIGGSASTYSAFMQPVDTFAPNTLLVNIVKNAGTGVPSASTWFTADPFAGGQGFGWGKFWPATNGAGSVYLWEGKEAIVVLIMNTALNQAYCTIAGAIIDPETSDVNLDSEVDGRVYGVIRTGTVGPISGTYWTDGYDPASSFGQRRFMHYNGGSATSIYANNYSAGVFVPNTSTVGLLYPMFSHVTSPTATSMRTRSGLLARTAITYRFVPADNIMGRLRDIFMFTSAQNGQRVTSGVTPIGYVVAGSGVSNVHCIMLEHG
jgi:hypothetical protein